MYIPDHFAATDERNLIEVVRSAPLGTLVVNGPEGLQANHLPFVHRSAKQGPDTLCAHVPRANPLSDLPKGGVACLVIFNGPQGYISPSWYATKKEHGRVVPTWNYSVVHAHGRMAVIEDADWILEQLNQLTEQNESIRPKPWAVSDAPADFTRRLIGGLVGLEVTIERLEGKSKASQNQPAQNQASVLEALEAEQPDSELTRFMRNIISQL